MTAPNPAHGLGAHMRTLGRQLRPDKPLGVNEAAYLINVPHYPLEYAALTLVRLGERGVATLMEGGFIRGPRWNASATHYGWMKDESTASLRARSQLWPASQNEEPDDE